MASSRVGTRISARTPVAVGCAPSFSMMGSRNAKVFPVPVWAVAKTSLPSSACGMAISWTGVGVVKCAAANFCWSPADRDISLNCVNRFLLSRRGNSRICIQRCESRRIQLMPLEFGRSLSDLRKPRGGNQIKPDRTIRTTSAVQYSVYRDYTTAPSAIPRIAPKENLCKQLLAEIVEVKAKWLTFFIMRNHEFRGSFGGGIRFLLALGLFLRSERLLFLAGTFFLPLCEGCTRTSCHPPRSFHSPLIRLGRNENDSLVFRNTKLATYIFFLNCITLQGGAAANTLSR